MQGRRDSVPFYYRPLCNCGCVCIYIVLVQEECMDNICYGPIVKLVFVALYCKRAGRWREGWEGPPAERKQRRRDRPRAAFASHALHSPRDCAILTLFGQGGKYAYTGWAVSTLPQGEILDHVPAGHRLAQQEERDLCQLPPQSKQAAGQGQVLVYACTHETACCNKAVMT